MKNLLIKLAFFFAFFFPCLVAQVTTSQDHPESHHVDQQALPDGTNINDHHRALEEPPNLNLYKVTFPNGTAVGKLSNPKERKNAQYIQLERIKRGLPKVYYSEDLIKEARRWAREIAKTGKITKRSPLSQNIDDPWVYLSDVYVIKPSVSYDGAHSTLMKSDRQYDMLKKEVNRIGVGIVKDKVNKGFYVMVQTYMQV